ncbi:MAG: tRNA uridine-5-carboxymethylaminomethyl(34) synthesis GTPase MnmE [Dorea sp.]|jgi:tRNA modification GTPase|nr:tRNA uridine-5-carboxymethylaminomethyl(34) synthesis GTPase MnmE [Dorea sp.]
MFYKSEKDTIAAISTAVSDSGIGIVRISGEEAIEIADKVYLGKNNKRLISQRTHTIHYGYIVDNGTIIDEVLVMIMKGPKSFTGEDTIEINCHGGVYVVNRVLEIVIRNGARPAEPGEFTKRAFLNGRIDLSQAEAVIDVIQSENEYALQSSVNQLRGSIKNKISDVRKKILYQTAFIESALDDPEHICVDGYGEQLKEVLLELMGEIQKMIDSASDGKVIKEGIQTVILGKPNVGKSSLLNALIGEDRAIVTDIAGTTRDVLQEHIRLKGISLNIMDTAGIRKTDDVIEKIGVDKAINHAKESDLIIYIVDSSIPLDSSEFNTLQLLKEKKSIILLNKSDLTSAVQIDDIVTEYLVHNDYVEEFNIPVIEISAKTGQGIEELEQTIRDMFYHGKISFNSEIYITNMRHKKALMQAYESLAKVMQSIDLMMPEDFYSIDLMDAYESLGSIIGESMGEDLVNEIFSKFCMGK